MLVKACYSNQSCQKLSKCLKLAKVAVKVSEINMLTQQCNISTSVFFVTELLLDSCPPKIEGCYETSMGVNERLIKSAVKAP